MRTARQLLGGLWIALLSGGIILGGLSLSLAEGDMTVLPSDTPALPSPSPTVPAFPPPVETAAPSLPPTETASPLPVTPPPSCPPPAGWQAYLVQPGDTLQVLAVSYNTTPEALIQANCLPTASLQPGAYLYLPPAPTRTPIPCGPPSSWIRYTVVRGDTLYSLAQYYGVTVQQIQQANCMGSSTILVTGRQLYVPPKPPRTFTPTPSLTATYTSTPTHTPETPTSTPTASDTPVPTSTYTPEPTNTNTPVPTNTNTPPSP
jgi:type VI secretion system secreted protein VgrG